MANTFTANYNLIKSEVGGDNASWGDNLHTTLENVDVGMGKLIEDQLISGITNSAINLTASGSDGIISTSANLKYFESVQVGDKIRVSTTNADNTVNGTAANPAIHTVKSKTSADSITVSTNIITDTASTVTVAKVLEPVHINSGPIICAPLSSLSSYATRALGGTATQGTDTTDALVANGDVILGSSTTNDIVTFTSKISSDFHPKTDNTYDLGTGDNSWKDLHVEGTSTLGIVAVAAGTIAGITVTDAGVSGAGPGSAEKLVNLSVTGTSGGFSNFRFGSNGQGAKTVSTSAPSATTGYANGDVWYEITS